MKKRNRLWGTVLGFFLVVLFNLSFFCFIPLLYFAEFLSMATRGLSFSSLPWFIYWPWAGIGLSQLLYIAPWYIGLTKDRHWGMRKGIVLGSGVTFVFSSLFVVIEVLYSVFGISL